MWTLIADVASDIVDAHQRQMDTLKWLSILMVVVIIGFGAILLLRRFLRDPVGGTTDNPGFSLSDLRAMRDRGEITPEEYEITRARVISKVKSMANAPKPGKAAPLTSDMIPAADPVPPLLPPTPPSHPEDLA